MTTIATLPPAPQPTDDTSTFNAKAFALLAALAAFVTETNAVAGETNTAAGNSATSAATSAAQAAAALASQLAAAASANASAASAGATAWNPATNYTLGQRVWSPIDQQLYRRAVPGISATDPSADSTNSGSWALVRSVSESISLLNAGIF